MTVCVAAIADRGKVLILAADKMVGIGSIEAEPDVEKILPIHRDWRVMISGNGIWPVFDIVDLAKRRLPSSRRVPLRAVMSAVSEAYEEKRLRDATALYLSPRGMTVKDLKSERSKNPDANLFLQLDRLVSDFKYELEILVAGFDSSGHAQIFSLDTSNWRGVVHRHDIPGFHAVGSGSSAAIHMMYTRELSANIPARVALYYAFEGKYFGEQASGVGWKTDLYVWRQGRRPQKISEEVIEEMLVKQLCERLEPRPLAAQHIATLNKIPGLPALRKVRIVENKKTKSKRLVS